MSPISRSFHARGEPRWISYVMMVGRKACTKIRTSRATPLLNPTWFWSSPSLLATSAILSPREGNGGTTNWEWYNLLVTSCSPSIGTSDSSAGLSRDASIQNLTNLFPLESTSVTANLPSCSSTRSVRKKRPHFNTCFIVMLNGCLKDQTLSRTRLASWFLKTAVSPRDHCSGSPISIRIAPALTSLWTVLKSVAMLAGVLECLEVFPHFNSSNHCRRGRVIVIFKIWGHIWQAISPSNDLIFREVNSRISGLRMVTSWACSLTCSMSGDLRFPRTQEHCFQMTAAQQRCFQLHLRDESRFG